MAVGTPILASDYNGIHNLMSPIVGPTTSNVDLGYGRTLLSDLVVGGSTPGVSDVITSLQQYDLWKDLQAGHIHQFATDNTRIALNRVDVGDIIQWANITDFTLFVNDVISFNRDTTEFPSANFDEAGMLTSSSTTVTSTRSTAWGTGGTYRIGHRVTVSWSSANARNHFFNAGGQIRFDASLTGGTTGTTNSKDWDWNRILAEMGKIRFWKKATNYFTESLGTGGTGSEYALGSISTNSATSGGFFNSATRLYTKVGGGVSGGNTGAIPVEQIYDDNEYQINLVIPNDSQMIFEIIFDDSDTGTGYQVESGEQGSPTDEQVGGTVTSNLYTFTPNSTFNIGASTFNAIVQTPPTGAVDSSL
jgi:hypothetical protein